MMTDKKITKRDMVRGFGAVGSLAAAASLSATASAQVRRERAVARPMSAMSEPCGDTVFEGVAQKIARNYSGGEFDLMRFIKNATHIAKMEAPSLKDFAEFTGSESTAKEMLSAISKYTGDGGDSGGGALKRGRPFWKAFGKVVGKVAEIVLGVLTSP